MNNKKLEYTEKTYKLLVRRWEQRHQLITAILLGVGIIMFWRGVWRLLDLYLFPGTPWLSSTISILAGLFLLYINDLSLTEIKTWK